MAMANGEIIQFVKNYLTKMSEVKTKALSPVGKDVLRKN
jgi:hypothetical protein